jgi:hypothetical protein
MTVMAHIFGVPLPAGMRKAIRAVNTRWTITKSRVNLD